MDLICQDYAIDNGIAGIEMVNERTRRLAWFSSYPDQPDGLLTVGTIDNNHFTTTATTYLDPTHVGCTVKLTNSSGTVLFTSTVQSVVNMQECYFVDNYLPSTPLSSSLRLQIFDTIGWRRMANVSDLGQDNRIIGKFDHDDGDGIDSFIAAKRTQSYYGFCRANGWLDPGNRDHTHPMYTQNVLVDGYKSYIGNLSFENGGTNGKFDSVSGDAEAFIIEGEYTSANEVVAFSIEVVKKLGP